MHQKKTLGVVRKMGPGSFLTYVGHGDPRAPIERIKVVPNYSHLRSMSKKRKKKEM